MARRRKLSPVLAELKHRKLSPSVLAELKPRKTDYVLWDTDNKRLCVRVYPTGRKVFLLRLRVDGAQRWFKVGTYGDPWTVDSARTEADRIAGQAAQVIALRKTGAASPTLLHPVEARDRERTVPTLAKFAERYIREHSVPHKAPRSADEDRSLLGLPRALRKRARKADDGSDADTPRASTILGALGDRRIDRITRADVTAYHLSLRETPTRANRALALLSHVFNTAEKWGARPDGTNPCRHVARFKEEKRERFLSAAELARVGKALAAADRQKRLTPHGLAGLRLLIFTGARASEILGLTWEQVDLAAGSVRIVRKGGHVWTLQLPPPAQKVLKVLPRFKGNPYVIAGAREGLPLTLWGLEQVWQEIRTAAAVRDVRLHDLRHSWASVAAAKGQSLPVIGALLGHTQPQTTARYAHLANDPLATAAAAVAEDIASAMSKRTKRADNLTNIGQARRAGR